MCHLNNMTPSLKLLVAIGTKLALPRKDMTWHTVTDCLYNKECANSFILSILSNERDKYIHYIPTHT